MSKLLKGSLPPAQDNSVLEKLLGVNSSSEGQSDIIDSDDGISVVEETFGQGANQRVLLVTKGLSLKKIVEASK